jgi:hypothetical protein
MFQKWGSGYDLDLSDSGLGPVASPCEYGNELLGSIKFGELLYQLSVGNC